MSKTAKSRAAALAHLRSADFAKGDPIPLPLTMASIFHTPGAEAGFD
ncbi:cystathionine gamma-lyase, partial [Mesorhizobium sp. M5C.F.Ca.ET.164.01.1.1]